MSVMWHRQWAVCRPVWVTRSTWAPHGTTSEATDGRRRRVCRPLTCSFTRRRRATRSTPGSRRRRNAKKSRRSQSCCTRRNRSRRRESLVRRSPSFNVGNSVGQKAESRGKLSLCMLYVEQSMLQMCLGVGTFTSHQARGNHFSTGGGR